jgi:TonB-dependent receptor
MSKTILILIVSTIYFFSVSNAYSQEMGSLKGTVIDKDNGDPLISATVFIKGTKKGANTKFDGTFLIKDIPAGTYDVEISYIGFKKYEITGLEIKPGKMNSIDVLMISDVSTTEEVVVTAKAVKETGAALLKERQKAAAFSDAIGAQEIAKSGGSDAADAVKKITGATVVGGKHVFVRGLGNRYAKTQLNGAAMPSADPDQRSVHLDMFGTGMIENITTVKTATPDKPGDFTGGAVDIKTKSYPDKFFTTVSMSSGYNPQVTGNEMLLGNRTSSDWLGMDDGSRSMPKAIQDAINSDRPIPNGKSIFNVNRHLEDAEYLVGLTRSFENPMAPVSYTAPVNSSFSISSGNQYQIGGSPFGFLASLNYDQSFVSYQNGEFGRYFQTGRNNEFLFPDYKVRDSKGIHKIHWGGLVNLSYTFLKYNEIGVNFMYNQAADHFGRSQTGYYNGSAILGRGFQSYATRYTERNLFTYQLHGKHTIPSALGIKLDWQVSFSENQMLEPDARFFAYDFKLPASDSADVQKVIPDPENPEFTINRSAYTEPARIFRKMTEDALNYNANLEIPFKKVVGSEFSLKFGTSILRTQRAFDERWFIYGTTSSNGGHIQPVDIDGNPYEFDPATLFDRMAGISRSGNFIELPVYISYFGPEQFSYDGRMDIDAYYAMADFELFNKIRIIGGVRFENSILKAIPRDTTGTKLRNYVSTYRIENNIPDSVDLSNLTFDDFGIDENDVLPSINLVYELSKNANIRLAYSKTIARPNLREIAPYSSFDFLGDWLYIGNPFLKRSLINNYDFRMEWFPNVGEILAASVFYKEIDNPIELALVSVNEQVQFQNSRFGTIIGAEFELRKSLSKSIEMFGLSAPDWTNQFSYAFNLTLARSEVEIADGREKEAILSIDSTAKTTREFLGQSPYVVNFDIAYSNQKFGSDVSLNFNVFGSRLSTIMYGVTPNIYERPRPDLNLTYSQRIYKNLSARFAARNLLNAYTLFSQNYLGQDYYNERYRLGRQISLSLSYRFE